MAEPVCASCGEVIQKSDPEAVSPSRCRSCGALAVPRRPGEGRRVRRSLVAVWWVGVAVIVCGTSIAAGIADASWEPCGMGTFCISPVVGVVAGGIAAFLVWTVVCLVAAVLRRLLPRAEAGFEPASQWGIGVLVIVVVCGMLGLVASFAEGSQVMARYGDWGRILAVAVGLIAGWSFVWWQRRTSGRPVIGWWLAAVSLGGVAVIAFFGARGGHADDGARYDIGRCRPVSDAVVSRITEHFPVGRRYQIEDYRYSAELLWADAVATMAILDDGEWWVMSVIFLEEREFVYDRTPASGWAYFSADGPDDADSLACYGFTFGGCRRITTLPDSARPEAGTEAYRTLQSCLGSPPPPERSRDDSAATTGTVPTTTRPSTTTTAASSATTTPAGLPSGWTLDPDGVGPARAGMPRSEFIGEMVEILGDPDGYQPDRWRRCWTHEWWEDAGLTLMYSPTTTSLVGYAVTGGVTVTPEGIRVGADFDDVKAAYPHATLESGDWSGLQVVSESGGGYRFGFRGPARAGRQVDVIEGGLPEVCSYEEGD